MGREIKSGTPGGSMAHKFVRPIWEAVEWEACGEASGEKM